MESSDGESVVTTIGEKLAPFNPSDPKVVETAIRLLEIQEGDVVYDLGCGDGRFLIAACAMNRNIVAKGIEYDKLYFDRAELAVQQSGFADRITVIHGNVLDWDFSDAKAVFMYLVPTGIRKVKEKLISLLESGVRIVTYVFSIPGIRPVHEELFKGSTKIYKYTAESLVVENDSTSKDL